MRSRDWSKVLAGLALAAPIPMIAQAETYLTQDQAAAVLFPGVKMKPRVMELSPLDVASIEKASGEKVPSPHVRTAWGPSGEALIIDAVIGKHQYITYAVGVSSEGKVQGVEIMDYRETIGYQVRDARWRRQFVGKTSKDPVTLNKDIQNISGATLSSNHVTNGVRRLLRTYDVLKLKS
jgi:Na+-translocating ferredoxin:NAD+ oxidoreductase RnfG subunit